jgi:hypothetical protein
MKLQDLTIDQFQRIAALEFSPVLTDYDKRAGVVAIVEGVDISLVREMPAKGLTKRYKTIIAEWNELPTLAYRRRFKAGGKWWIPTVFTDELTAGQLIDLMDTDTTDEKKLVPKPAPHHGDLVQGGWVPRLLPEEIRRGIPPRAG